MKKEEVIEKLAELIVKKGVNIQKGQPLNVSSNLESAPLAIAITKEAYKAGASWVHVDFDDAYISKYGLMYQSEEQLKKVPEWIMDKYLYGIREGVAMVSIASPKPNAMVGVDPKKIQMQQMAMQSHPKFAEIMDYSMSNKGQWCVCSYPNFEWAKKVFPNLPEEEVFDKLFDAILKTSRVDNDPIKAWEKHNANMAKRSKIMNEFNFKSLHYKNSLGTDFTIELIPNHIWSGGSENSAKGIEFNPNIPTEEVFTAPNKYGVNGKVVATKPLFTQGKLVEDFWFEFKDGKVVNYGAKKEQAVLKNIVENDPGSCYLGEVALVPFDSPIQQSGILFYNTLFDENASCHLALGMAYPSCLKGGTEMSFEQQEKAGLNHAKTHVDFMVGSKDLEIIGTKFDGTTVQVFKNGNFTF
ncbi:MAG: aminopeptidase [Bacilli bacterium]|jgi:aminopeptidase|nr:aminopeptidase [Bacilli bacterium]MDD3421936.1 aminopeptidase [Bacilli bacterium]MDD4065402.1 aminopeptidase [Bacilli bacterium]